jgi:hypothetical protein
MVFGTRDLLYLLIVTYVRSELHARTMLRYLLYCHHLPSHHHVGLSHPTPNTQHPHRLPTAEDATDHHQIGKELLGVRQRLGVTCLLCDISLLVDRQPGTLD